MGVELASEKATFHEMEDVSISDSELVHHVKDALKSVSLGDSGSYDQLIGVLHCKRYLGPEHIAMLVTSLKALSGAVYYIDIVHHESLLNTIFGMSIWNYGQDVMDALVELIISLAASGGKYVDSCLEMLVSNFMPPVSFLNLLKGPHGRARKDLILPRVHSALQDIAYLVPLSPSRLLTIVLNKMPNIYTKEPLIAIYVENMLRLESSEIGELVGSTILVALVDRLIDLDVEIGWNDILEDDSNKGIFEMELEDMDEGVDDAQNSIDEFLGLNRKSLSGNIIANKLDSLMVLTFEHLNSCADAGRLVKVFETFLQSFQITVLNAYKSKFAQFVMFYACSLHPEECGVKFPTMLVDMFFSGIYPPITRMSAVAYLASYLSRAKFLPATFIAKILQRLVNWCYEYCQLQAGASDINAKAHRIFYSACQAIMYVLCFRTRSMINVPRLKTELLNMPLESILKHPLNPLKVCLPSIVFEFLRQAKDAQLYMIPESEIFIFNDMLESDLSKAFGGVERLDMFFPFDPCLLKQSDRYIRPNFVYWSMVRTTGADDEYDSSDDDVADAHNTDDDAPTGSFEDLDDVMNQMSITPKKFSFGGQVHATMQMPSRIRPSTSPESL